MARLTVVSTRDYRQHVLEIEERGNGTCSVVVHPPARLGRSRLVEPTGESTLLIDLVNQAKAEIDAVMGPKPPPRRPPMRRHYG
ncbi:hypothetical protein SAMN02745194_00077 [Roseomonas rosea]|jgi:hypothetical protein|uniref:Uncharacterized protein n=1 Tax=Muricoccus roseus TaxID=198092 RepID=A0A1M6ACN2_9PROT|nr:hypothetical protein [Roseomonas rosea]SHI34225.1 hypothetical protein SAMN02745194_00077 [Roseomonas rosea]